MLFFCAITCSYGVLLAVRAPRLQLLEEVVALIVNEDERREVLNGNLPDSLHAEFGIFYALDALDRALRQNGSHATDCAEIESAVLLASVGHYLRTVTLGNHNERCAVILELVYVRVHTIGSGRTH